MPVASSKIFVVASLFSHNPQPSRMHVANCSIRVGDLLKVFLTQGIALVAQLVRMIGERNLTTTIKEKKKT
jgi:hypothetical protein